MNSDELIDKLTKDVYDIVQHEKEDDIWTAAEREAQKEFDRLTLMERATIAMNYVSDTKNLYDLFSDIGCECAIMKRAAIITEKHNASKKGYKRLSGL